MTWLILGLALWVGAHLFKRLAPDARAAMRASIALNRLTGIDFSSAEAIPVEELDRVSEDRPD